MIRFAPLLARLGLLSLPSCERRPAVAGSFLLCLLAGAWSWSGVLPLSGAEALAADHTLVLYSVPRVSFGLGNELELLLLQLRRREGRVETSPLTNATPSMLARMEAASRWVVFCPQPGAVVPLPVLRQLRSGVHPVLWVGYLPVLPEGEPAWAHFEARPDAAGPMRQARYHGRDIDLAGAYGSPVTVAAGTTATPQIELNSSPAGTTATCLCWQDGAAWFFSAVPASGPVGFLFSDVLLDFFPATPPEPSRVFLRIDEYQAGSDHAEFRRKVDHLRSRGRPFLVSVIPSWKTAGTGVVAGAVVTLDAAPDFVDGLKYAQAHGGRLLLGGCVRPAREQPEFWDGDLDRPLPDRPGEVGRQLGEAVGLMVKHGLIPLGWRTPHDAASRAVRAEVSRAFSTAVERPQLSDLTQAEAAVLSAPTRDAGGCRVFPENLGFLPASAGGALAALQERTGLLARLRGAVAGACFQAYLPIETLAQLTQALEKVEKPFLDLLEQDNWVQVPGRLILTGDATRAVKLAGGVVTWKAFGPDGRELKVEQEFALPGDRVLKRKGTGTAELYEYKEVTP